MVKKRVIPCLDVARGRVVKGVNFRDLRELGDPVELARRYSELGADELVFLDITATLEGRGPILDVIGRAADELTIPFTAGGGVTGVADARDLLLAGADKVAINRAAFDDPDILGALAAEFGAQAVVDRGAVDGDLVRAGPQERAGILEPRDAAADGERDLELLGGVADELEQRASALECRGDVEEDELVGAELRVAGGELDRIAHLAQLLEADALDDAAAGDVEAGDHPLLDHARAFSSKRAPAGPLRSGWNWTPATGPRSTAATTVPSWSTSATATGPSGAHAYEWAK